MSGQATTNQGLPTLDEQCYALAMLNYLQLLLRRTFSFVWGWGDFISGAIGFAIPVAALFFPQWGERINGDLWLVPLWALASALIFRLLFAAPYELWRVEKGRADGFAATIEAFAAERALRFSDVIFKFDYSGPNSMLSGLKFTHENVGEQLLQYRIAEIWVEAAGARVAIPSVDSFTYQQPHSSGHFDCDLPNPIMVSDYPALIRVNFDYIYDNVPPTRQRQSGAAVRYLVAGASLGSPVDGYWFDEQREK